MSNKTCGSARIDLVGGTLDLWPINLVIPHVNTINMAINLQTHVEIEKTSEDSLQLVSSDYDIDRIISKDEWTEENIYLTDYFGPLKFVVQILDYFQLSSGVKVTLGSDIPPGSGLGGSSVLGVTLVKAISDFSELSLSSDKMIKITSLIESRILGQGPTGYQDYYPAIYGGVLGLKAKIPEIEVKQFYAEELVKVLEKNITLIYSGVSRVSGLTNWEVYKSFFNGDKDVVEKLFAIGDLSQKADTALEKKDYEGLLKLINEEGIVREKLCPDIYSKEILAFKKDLSSLGKKVLGMKVCGAGGGGCFIVIHEEDLQTQIAELTQKHSMKVLDFQISQPIKN